LALATGAGIETTHVLDRRPDLQRTHVSGGMPRQHRPLPSPGAGGRGGRRR
jgi:hypothetical protein